MGYGIRRRLWTVGLVLGATLPGGASAAQGRAGPAAELLRTAIEVMGGDRLHAIETVRWTGMASDELPGIVLWGGPAVGMYRKFTELRDLAHKRLRRTSTLVLPMRPAPIAFTEIITPVAAAQVVGGRVIAGSPTQRTEGEASMTYGPERALFTALAAPDAAIGPDTMIAGARQRVVRFDGGRAAVYLDAKSMLLTAVAVTQSLTGDQTWGMWGDVTTLTLFAAWSWAPGGVRLPYQLTVFRNGRPLRRVVLREVARDVAAPADSFPMDDSVVAQYRAHSRVALAGGSGGQRELAGGVVLVPGRYNVVLVKQTDGVIVLGAPLSAEYARLILDEVAHRFPRTTVTALVAASSTWPHIAGVREFVARGIPVYIAAAGADLVRAVVRAPHRLAPDSLARAPRDAVLHEVAQRMMIGTGNNRLDLLPNIGRGSSHPDQMAVYLPSHGLLFAADLYRPERFEPNLWRQPLAELVELVRRAGIQPDTVVGLSVGPAPWGEAVSGLGGGSH